MAYVFHTAEEAPSVDIRLLRYRDRATLRILDRAEAATASQLAILVYGHPRTAQRRLAALWHAGLLERTAIARHQHGAATYAYRLSRLARQRLGDRSRRSRGSIRLGHTLDIVETICALALAKGDPRTRSPVQAWLAEASATELLGGPPYPDSIVVLSDEDRSGVICLEMDEATQRASVIAAKLRGYRRLLEEQPGWLVLFVVPSSARARWMRNLAPVEERAAQRTWVTTLPALRADGLNAVTVSLGRVHRAARLSDLLGDPRPRRSGQEVATEAWIRVLGEGGGEDLDALLA